MPNVRGLMLELQRHPSPADSYMDIRALSSSPFLHYDSILSFLNVPPA